MLLREELLTLICFDIFFKIGEVILPEFGSPHVQSIRTITT